MMTSFQEHFMRSMCIGENLSPTYDMMLHKMLQKKHEKVFFIPKELGLLDTVFLLDITRPTKTWTRLTGYQF